MATGTDASDSTTGSGGSTASAEPVTILAVDDQPENLELLDVILSDAGYRVVTAENGVRALEAVAKIQPQTILLDIMMPGMDGFEVCRRLKASRRTYYIPVVMLTALADVESKIKGLESGADDFLNKPINMVELLTRIRSLGRIRALRDELDSTESIMFSMVEALESKLPQTRDHSLRVADLAARVGRDLGLEAKEQEGLVWGALLHDLGKIGVREDVLLTPDRDRTPEQRQVYRQHPVQGERILGPLASLHAARVHVRHHHERLDGSGYPDGLAGDALARATEIVALANALDNHRMRAPDDPEGIAARLRDEAARGKWRPELVDKVLATADGLSGDPPELLELLPVAAPVQRGRIFIADDNESNRVVLEEYLLDAGYTVTAYASGVELVAAIEREEPDLVLVDVRMPGLGGEEVCQRLKSDPRFAYMPIVLVTAHSGVTSKQRALEVGADEFLSVPLNRQELIARVRSLLRLRTYHNDLEQRESVVLSLSGVLEAKDPYTRGHSARVGELSRELAEEMGLPREMVETMVTAGLLHDIGKVAVPQSILHKPGRLTQEELEVVMTHPTYGWEICKNLRSAQAVLPCIRSHHERFDGSGYPDGLAGTDIPLGPRVLGLADAFDALTSARPYRSKLTVERAFEILGEETEQGKWDLEVFKALESLRRQGRLHDRKDSGQFPPLASPPS